MTPEINTLYTNKTVIPTNTGTRKAYAWARMVLFGVFVVALHPLRGLAAVFRVVIMPGVLLVAASLGLMWFTVPEAWFWPAASGVGAVVGVLVLAQASRD